MRKNARFGGAVVVFLLIHAIALDVTEVATHRINEASEQQAEGADIRKCRTDNEIKRLFNMPGTMTEDEIRDQVESNRRIRTPIKPVQLRGVLPTSTMATIAPTSTIPTEVGGSPYAFSFSANLENNGNVGNVATAETSKDRFHRRKTTFASKSPARSATSSKATSGNRMRRDVFVHQRRQTWQTQQPQPPVRYQKFNKGDVVWHKKAGRRGKIVKVDYGKDEHGVAVFDYHMKVDDIHNEEGREIGSAPENLELYDPVKHG